MLDRFWWWCNRKPAPKWMPYLSTAIPYMFSGALFFIGLSLLATPGVLAGILMLLLGLVMSGSYLWSDWKHGYVAAFHKAYLEHRKEVGLRIGKTEEEIEGETKDE